MYVEHHSRVLLTSFAGALDKTVGEPFNDRPVPQMSARRRQRAKFSVLARLIEVPHLTGQLTGWRCFRHIL